MVIQRGCTIYTKTVGGELSNHGAAYRSDATLSVRFAAGHALAGGPIAALAGQAVLLIFTARLATSALAAGTGAAVFVTTTLLICAIAATTDLPRGTLGIALTGTISGTLKRHQITALAGEAIFVAAALTGNTGLERRRSLYAVGRLIAGVVLGLIDLIFVFTRIALRDVSGASQ